MCICGHDAGECDGFQKWCCSHGLQPRICKHECMFFFEIHVQSTQFVVFLFCFFPLGPRVWVCERVRACVRVCIGTCVRARVCVGRESLLECFDVMILYADKMPPLAIPHLPV